MAVKVLFLGPTISSDTTLLEFLRHQIDPVIMADVREINQNEVVEGISLIIFETHLILKKEIAFIKGLKEKYPKTKIIYVGKNSPEEVLRTLKAGVDDYFKIPYDPFLLAERVEALLSKII